MSFAAAARGPMQAAPLGQWVLVGLGVFYAANPEKFFQTFQRGLHFLTEQPNSPHAVQQPIVIHSGPSATPTKPMVGYLVQVAMGVGACWGSYMVLVTVLPEAAKGLLPVTKSFFNQAVSSLGDSIIKVRQAMLEKISGLSAKQDELSEKQDETHSEVLFVKDDVRNIGMDLDQVQDTLDLCQQSLTEAEKRQLYISRGVRLLTRGVSSILPQDASLAYELEKFNKQGNEFSQPSPLLSKQQSQEAASGNAAAAAEKKRVPSEERRRRAVPPTPAGGVAKLSAPENDHPGAPSGAPVKKEELQELRELLNMVRA